MIFDVSLRFQNYDKYEIYVRLNKTIKRLQIGA